MLSKVALRRRWAGAAAAAVRVEGAEAGPWVLGAGGLHPFGCWSR